MKFGVKVLLLLIVASLNEARAATLGPLSIATDERLLPPMTCGVATVQGCIIPTLLKMALQSLEYGYNLRQMSETRQYLELGSGRTHAAVIFTTNIQNLEGFPDSITICKKPAYSTPVGLYIDRRHPIAADTIESLTQYRLVAPRLPKFQRNLLGEKFKHVVRTNNIEQAIYTLLAGRADYTLYATHITDLLLRQRQLDERIVWVKDMFDVHYHFAISNHALSIEPDLIKICDNIQTIKASGAIDAMAAQVLDDWGLSPRK